jgi:putative tryptophan/tyrosine transport system substrate-binding protein
MSDMKRREFIALLGGAVAAWPLAARAQQVPVIGFLGTDTADLRRHQLRAFRTGLNEAGYDEGRNLAVEYRWAEGRYDRLGALAADLVQRQVSVIVANGPAAIAAKAASTTIPIVFIVGFDPVELGLVATLNRPGGNLTGVSNLNAELGPKRLERLHELVPTATIIALLVNPTNPNSETVSKDVQAAARKLRLQLHVLHASTEREIDNAFVTLAQLRAAALVIGTDGFFVGQSERLAALTVRHKMPTIFQDREFASAGGLMSYGGSNADAYRLLAAYVGRNLKGEKPADLPVQQTTKVELVINLKTARALGLTVPLIMQMTADEVIE